MPLPPYYLEVILVSGMVCLVAVVMDGRGGLWVLFVSFTKGPGGFPYILIIKKICGRYGIQTHFKGGRTIKNLLVSPKDKDPIVNQSGTFYWYQCGNLGCDDEYIGETSRTFGERYKEHPKAPSAIHHHSNQADHTTNQNNFQIIGREGHNLARNI